MQPQSSSNRRDRPGLNFDAVYNLFVLCRFRQFELSGFNHFNTPQTSDTAPVVESEGFGEPSCKREAPRSLKHGPIPVRKRHHESPRVPSGRLGEATAFETFGWMGSIMLLVSGQPSDILLKFLQLHYQYARIA
jgi:hypothetical protein